MEVRFFLNFPFYFQTKILMVKKGINEGEQKILNYNKNQTLALNFCPQLSGERGKKYLCTIKNESFFTSIALRSSTPYIKSFFKAD